MILNEIEQFAIILVVGVHVAFVLGYQWALEEFKKEGGNIDEKNRRNEKQ